MYEQNEMKVFSPEAGFVILQGSSLLRARRLWSVYMLKGEEVLNKCDGKYLDIKNDSAVILSYFNSITKLTSKILTT